LLLEFTRSKERKAIITKFDVNGWRAVKSSSRAIALAALPDLFAGIQFALSRSTSELRGKEWRLEDEFVDFKLCDLRQKSERRLHRCRQAVLVERQKLPGTRSNQSDVEDVVGRLSDSLQ
jgi:hypothetical protein